MVAHFLRPLKICVIWSLFEITAALGSLWQIFLEEKSRFSSCSQTLKGIFYFDIFPVNLKFDQFLTKIRIIFGYWTKSKSLHWSRFFIFLVTSKTVCQWLRKWKNLVNVRTDHFSILSHLRRFFETFVSSMVLFWNFRK